MADESRSTPMTPPEPVVAPVPRQWRLRRRAWLVLGLLALAFRYAAWDFILRFLDVHDRDRFFGLFVLAACLCAALACVRATVNRR